MNWLSRARGRSKGSEEFLDDVFVHSDALYRYALRLTANPDRARDLVQDAMVRAFKAYPRLRPNTDHRAWAFTILRNRFISLQRRAGRELNLEDPDRLPSREVAPQAAALVRADDGYKQGFEDEVALALQSLPEHQRTAVVLCDIDGMTYQEIAAVMECPVGTIRSRIHHGRRRLRSELVSYAQQRGYSKKADEATR